MRLRFSARLVLTLGIVGAVAYVVGGPQLRSAISAVHLLDPAAYSKGSELYYLAWIQHGSFGQRGGAARKLLSLPNRREYETTRRMRLLEQRRSSLFGDHDGDQVIDHMLLIALFDLRPAEYHRDLADLARRAPHAAEDIWVKTDDMFDGELMDFRFNPAQEARIRLQNGGYAESADRRQ